MQPVDIREAGAVRATRGAATAAGHKF